MLEELKLGTDTDRDVLAERPFSSANEFMSVSVELGKQLIAESDVEGRLELHTLVLDGVYVREPAGALLVLHELPAPCMDDVAEFTRRGGSSDDAGADGACAVFVGAQIASYDA